MKAEKDIKIAFVDYLQLMHVSTAFAQYRALEIGEISRQLKETAKELKIPIIALAQLNRNLTARIGTSNGRPRLSDLKDSGSIEQDADMVLFIHRPALLGLSEETEDYAELIIEKNRSGETAIIKMTFNGDQVKFTDNAVSLQSYADAIAEKQKSAPTTPASWDMVSGIVGSYNPFDTYEGNQQF